MAKLYFKYGAMGSSKSAQALITQFNYEELGMTVVEGDPNLPVSREYIRIAHAVMEEGETP